MLIHTYKVNDSHASDAWDLRPEHRTTSRVAGGRGRCNADPSSKAAAMRLTKIKALQLRKPPNPNSRPILLKTLQSRTFQTHALRNRT